MKIVNILLLCILLVGFCASSCGGNSSSGCSDVETDQKESELSTAQGVLSNAQFAYIMDETPANCEAYTDAWDDYLVKLKSFINCLEGPAKDLWEPIYQNQVQERNSFSC